MIIVRSEQSCCQYPNIAVSLKIKRILKSNFRKICWNIYAIEVWKKCVQLFQISRSEYLLKFLRLFSFYRCNYQSKFIFYFIVDNLTIRNLILSYYYQKMIWSLFIYEYDTWKNTCLLGICISSNTIIVYDRIIIHNGKQ